MPKKKKAKFKELDDMIRSLPHEFHEGRKLTDAEIAKKCQSMPITIGAVGIDDWNPKSARGKDKCQRAKQFLASPHYKIFEEAVEKLKSVANNAILGLQPADTTIDVTIALSENLAAIRTLEALITHIKHHASRAE